MIKEFDRPTLRLLYPEIETALAGIAKKHGVSIKVNGGNFMKDNATLKLEIATLGTDGKAVSRERTTWTQLATFYGLKPEWLDKTFNWYGKTFTITGLNPKARTAPVIAANGNGKLYKFRTEDVKSAMLTKEHKSQPLSAQLDQVKAHQEFLGTRNADTQAAIIVGRRNPNHAEIERRLADMRNNNPEGYYADGEHHAAGLSEKQIHDMHYRSIAREFLPGYKPLFASVEVPPPPPLPEAARRLLDEK